MTNLTEDQIVAGREHLALLVNGKPENQFWLPDQDIEQAKMVQSKMYNIIIDYYSGGQCCVWAYVSEDSKFVNGVATEDNEALAIFIASLRATEFEI